MRLAIKQTASARNFGVVLHQLPRNSQEHHDESMLISSIVFVVLGFIPIPQVTRVNPSTGLSLSIIPGALAAGNNPLFLALLVPVPMQWILLATCSFLLISSLLETANYICSYSMST
jgi:hypothetical protein